MSSFTTFLGKIVCLSLFGLLFSFASPAQGGDGEAMIRDVHDQLKQAAEASDAEQKGHLKQALGILHNLPPGSSRKHIISAVQYIKSALFELKKGDPDHKVDDYIRDAARQVRYLER